MNALTARARLISEDELQDAIIGAARTLGWKVAHFRPAMTTHGYRTAVAADGKGWPDLVLVRDRIVHAELKSMTGEESPEQLRWQIDLRAAGAEYYLWNPEDWLSGRVDKVLQRREQR